MHTSDTFSRIWSAFDAGEIVPTCAWCGRVRVDGTWLLPPPAALAAVDQRYTFSHSICDACADRARPVDRERVTAGAAARVLWAKRAPRSCARAAMVPVRIDLARKPSRLHLFLSPTYLLA